MPKPRKTSKIREFMLLDVSRIIEKFNVYVTLAIIPMTKDINKAFWSVFIFIKILSFSLLGRRISLLYHVYYKNFALLQYHIYSGNVYYQHKKFPHSSKYDIPTSYSLYVIKNKNFDNSISSTYQQKENIKSKLKCQESAVSTVMLTSNLLPVTCTSNCSGVNWGLGHQNNFKVGKYTWAIKEDHKKTGVDGKNPSWKCQSWPF